MKIPEGIAQYTGLTDEAITAKATELLAADTASDFTDENRTIEMVSVDVGDGFSRKLPAQMQFVGMSGGRAYFLRASRSETEKEETAVNAAIQELMQAKNITPGQAVPLDAMPPVAPPADTTAADVAALAAQQEPAADPPAAA